MNTGYIPKLSMGQNPFQGVSLTGKIHQTQFSPVQQGPSFKDVMMDTAKNVNHVMHQPDVLMKQAMTVGGVDVHDVMIANAKAELTINVTSQMATKILQAYDRILQIQI